MIQTENPGELKGLEVHGGDGSRIGKVDTIYLDNHTGRPEWAAVSTGMFGNKVSLVPLAEAERADNGLRVPYDKEQIKSAPQVEADHDLSEREEATLFEHYGVPYGGETVTAQVGHGQGQGYEGGAAGREGFADEGRDRGESREGVGRVGQAFGHEGQQTGAEPINQGQFTEGGQGTGQPVQGGFGQGGGAQQGGIQQGGVQQGSPAGAMGNQPLSGQDLGGGQVEHLEGGRLRLRRMVVTEYMPVSHEVTEPVQGQQAQGQPIQGQPGNG